MNAEPIVYVVDDDPGVLKALSRLLRVEGYAVQAFNSAEDFLQEHNPHVPGCLVLDMRMPNLNGLVLQQALLPLTDERFIVFITGHGDVAASVQAMKAGAVDFLTKPFCDEDFLAAIRRAIEKDEHTRKIRLRLQSIYGRMETLTPREYQVLRHVVAGRLNKQIAADLGIAEKTIKVHRARAMEKMEVTSLAELVRVVMELERFEGQGKDSPALHESEGGVADARQKIVGSPAMRPMLGTLRSPSVNLADRFASLALLRQR